MNVDWVIVATLLYPTLIAPESFAALLFINVELITFNVSKSLIAPP